MSRSTQAKLNRSNGHISVEHHDTDSPILPIAQIEKLHSFRPDRVDWVFDQTQLEAEYRRKHKNKVNNFIFIERFIGQICALAIGITGIVAGGYIALNGQPFAGASIAGVAIGSLAIVFLTGRIPRNKNPN